MLIWVAEKPHQEILPCSCLDSIEKYFFAFLRFELSLNPILNHIIEIPILALEVLQSFPPHS